MSDRRRYPNQDEWDDDLDLAGWDKPANPANRPPKRPAGERQPRPDPKSASVDDPSAVPYDPYRSPQPRRAPSTQDPYGAAPGRYEQYPSRQDGGSSQDPPSGQRVRPPSTLQPGGEYGYGEYPDPVQRQSSASVPGSRRGYPGDQAEINAPGYGPPAGRKRKTRPRGETRPRPSVAVPRPAINDGPVITIVAASLLSLVFMIATIAAGAGDLPEWFPIHLNASGDPDAWGTSDVLWRIPFGVLIAMTMSIAIAAVLWHRDRFAARFAVSGTALVQVLAWVALIDFIW